MKRLLTYLFLLTIVIGCSKEENPPPESNLVNTLESGWTVPVEQLVLSQLPSDRIPSIDDPHFEPLDNQNLKSNEIAYLYRHGSTVKVYPQNILWLHEIVNDKIGDHYFAISFCPLTGSAVAWNREVGGAVTEFGVSGHLFNENLIPYDRNSNSFWSQMRLEGIKGQHAGDALESGFLLSTTGATIQQAFPNAMVLVDTSEHQCDSVCRELKSGNELSGGDYFGIVNVGLIKDPVALLFNFETFAEGISVHQTFFGSSKIIVAGSKIHQFIVTFIDNTADPDIQFSPLQNQLPVIMEDSHGNSYDLTGLVVSGPNEGTRLPSPDGYFAHSFAWELFFGKNIEVFDE